MTDFNFKHWMQSCGFSRHQAAQRLSIPIALIACYEEETAKIPAKRMETCQSIFKAIEQERFEKKCLEKGRSLQTSQDFKECLDDLLSCFNSHKKGGVFWPVVDKAYFQFLDPYLDGDVHGIRYLEREIQTRFDENKFQPHTFTKTEIITQFYVIEFLPFDDDGRRWSDEDFYQYSLSTRYFQDKKKKLSERSILYLFGNNIDTLVEKVMK